MHNVQHVQHVHNEWCYDLGVLYCCYFRPQSINHIEMEHLYLVLFNGNTNHIHRAALNQLALTAPLSPVYTYCNMKGFLGFLFSPT